jgi:hypothetical protein
MVLHQERLGNEFLPHLRIALSTCGLTCWLDNRLPAGGANLGYILGSDAGPKLRLEISSYFVGTVLTDRKLSDVEKITFLAEKLQYPARLDIGCEGTVVIA